MRLTQFHIKGIMVTFIGVSVLAIYFLRKKKSIKSASQEEYIKEYFDNLQTNDNHHSETSNKSFEVMDLGKSSATRSLSSRNSIIKDVDIAPTKLDSEEMSYGRLALKSLDNVISNLESSICKFNHYETDHNIMDLPVDSQMLFEELKRLMEDAYRIREKYKQKLIITSSSYIGSDESDSSDNESFVSARDYYISDDINEYMDTAVEKQQYLFQAALMELENENILYREKRTQLVQCQTDTEFIAKMHCIRQAFTHISENEEFVKEFEDIGLNVGKKLLICLGYDTENFIQTYRRMLSFLHSPSSTSIMKDELNDKGVEIISLYDILFDYILFDSLEVLDNPPSSLVSIISNRWLSEGFKKSTLKSSIWTILLAKRKFLKHKSGFKAHFYDILDEIGAPLAWSFLGSEERANQVANAVKDHLSALAIYMYSDSPRLTTVEDLACDIMAKMRSTKDGLINEIEIISKVAQRC